MLSAADKSEMMAHIEVLDKIRDTCTADSSTRKVIEDWIADAKQILAESAAKNR